MFKNYFKIAWRNLTKNKLFSFINIIGLGLAIPFALLSLIQVQSSFESDNFHPYPNRTFRIITDVTNNVGAKTKYALSPQILEDHLKNYPAIDKATFVVRDFEWDLNNRIKTLGRVNTIYVEPDFFDIFGFKIIAGNRPELPNSLAITKEKAEAFFGTDDVVGKVLTHPQYGDFVITGVLAPYKRNTQLRSDVMVSMATYKNLSTDSSFAPLNGYTYALINQNTDKKNLNNALNSVATSINKEAVTRNSKDKMAFRPQPITGMAPDFEDLRGNAYVDSVSDLALSFAFALGLLLLAAFNYINLTLASSLSRAKEVGIRKVSGALRYQLVMQFICEALLVAFLSLGLGYVILKLLQQFSYVNWFAWSVDNNWALWVSFILFTILIGILAGIIPAKILSRFQPVKVLKGSISPSGFGKMGLRNSLVVIQFVASSIFIFLLASMFNQFRYMATDNENFNRKNIYNITVNEHARLIQNDLYKNDKVFKIGMVSTPFGGTTSQVPVRKTKMEENADASYFAANDAFIENMNLHFVAGGNLPPSVSDSSSDFVVVNEQLLTTLGLGDARKAIGKTFLLNNDHEVRIQGVVTNFCYYIYQFAANPLVLQYNPSQFHVLSIQTKSNVNADEFKAEINAVWKKYFPHDQLGFSDYQKDLYDRYFPGRDMKFMGMFCIAMLVIAILGMLGIVTFHTQKRIKEVSIRKVLGASVASIVKELSRSFIKLTIAAASITLPLGYLFCYYLMSLFTYSAGVNFILLLALFIGIFSIALITIVYKSIFTARANPIQNLRNE